MIFIFNASANGLDHIVPQTPGASYGVLPYLHDLRNVEAF
jgi:hypothetical protein